MCANMIVFLDEKSPRLYGLDAFVCVCVCAHVRACVNVCVCVCARIRAGKGQPQILSI